ncbi:hypothetical protein CAPI_06585 [Corynebacterium capitovis DSM 44611]|uniref:SWIM zinc finger family protein n=1 Tax=Corynebacterium capitovis TaxID=131081 RepID=UPI000361399E|nr:hypothetical protein [Corynebacterium capitovis]WKD57857.1 hypothetical protein CAPI_06585 [Corynebacterium capitovis DSM 44611]
MGASRPTEDNVIWANFWARRRVASAEEAAAESLEETPAPPPERYNPAAMRLLNAALRQTDAGRAKRGRQYVADGRVLSVTPRSAGFDGTVAGTQNDPFDVTISLPRRSFKDVDVALELMARRSGSVQRAREGDLDEDVMAILIAHDPSDVRFYCSCPDSAPVCKHACAVALKAAELIDADPAVVFALRNLSLTTLELRVRGQAEAAARDNAAEGSEFFWEGRELPALPRPKVAPMIEDSDMDLLHQAMQTVSFTNIDQMRAVADLEDLYDELTRR